MAKLTKKALDAAEVRTAPYWLWCSDLPGFGARIFPSGKRVYYADYRNKAGQRKRMSIGQHGKITTEEARKLALATLGSVVKGEDPAEERATRRNSLTVTELCGRYFDAADRGLIAGKGGKPKKPSTLAIDRGRVERHIIPLLGRKLVRDLAASDLNRFVRDVASGRTAVVEKTENKRGKAIVEGGPGTAARTMGLLGGILTFAVSEGVIPYNPANGVKRPADKRRSRRLTPDEYRQLGRVLIEGNDVVAQARCGAWLLALTGCRLGEIEALKWDEIDEAGGCFRLQDSKEGASVRPIGRSAFAVLAGIERGGDTDFVLPAIRGGIGSYGGMPGAWARLMERAGLKGVTAHTMRHSFASVAGDLGFTESTIAALLGHAAGSVTSRYVHHLDTVLVAAADRVAAAVHGFMIGVEGG